MDDKTTPNAKPRAGEHTKLERPRRQDYQADWTFADSMAEYATALERKSTALAAQNRELMEALRQIALEDPTREYAGTIARQMLAKVRP